MRDRDQIETAEEAVPFNEALSNTIKMGFDRGNNDVEVLFSRFRMGPFRSEKALVRFTDSVRSTKACGVITATGGAQSQPIGANVAPSAEAVVGNFVEAPRNGHGEMAKAFGTAFATKLGNETAALVGKILLYGLSVAGIIFLYWIGA